MSNKDALFIVGFNDDYGLKKTDCDDRVEINSCFIFFRQVIDKKQEGNTIIFFFLKKGKQNFC